MKKMRRRPLTRPLSSISRYSIKIDDFLKDSLCLLHNNVSEIYEIGGIGPMTKMWFVEPGRHCTSVDASKKKYLI